MVATSRRLEYVGRHQRERLLEQPEGVPHINIALAEFPSEDIAKLVQHWLRRNDDVLTNAVFQQITANAPRHEGGDQDVRIKD